MYKLWNLLLKKITFVQGCFVLHTLNKKTHNIFSCSGFLTALCRSDEKLELQWTLEGHQLGVVSVDISQNGAIAASSSLDAHIRLWDLETGKQVKSMDAGPGETFKMIIVTFS